MFYNLAMAQGDFRHICASEDVKVFIKAFCSTSAADGADVVQYLNGLLRNASDREANSIKILQATIYFVNLGDRRRAVNILKTLGKITLQELDPFVGSLILNLYTMLFKYLAVKEYTTDANTFDQTLDGRLAVVGDSHTLGLASGSRSLWTRGYYLPGLRLSHLSSPTGNLKIVGLQNALALSYDCESIIISVGEIDTRMTFKKAEQEPDLLPELVTKLNVNISPAMERINSASAPSQRIKLIVPPSPNIKVTDLTSQEKIQEAYGLFKRSFIGECTKYGFSAIEYGSVYEDNKNEYLLDHAHFVPEVYYDLVMRGISE